MNLEVGKPYAPLSGRGEGVIFDINDAGARLFYNFNNPTREEIESAKAGQPFQMKFVELNGIIWILSKCGDLQWTDAPYNPRASIYTNIHTPGESQGLLLTLCVSDCRTAEIKSIRTIGMEHKFSVALIEATERVRNTPMDYWAVYDSINATMLKYSTKDLVNMAKHRFVLR